MSARYLIRLDDACPTMSRERWTRVLNLLEKHEVKPIIAVIPENRDESLKIDTPDDYFWDTVRSWQSSGYTLALHGFDHVYLTSESGIIPINQQSEFAGLSFEEQKAKIKSGKQVFLKERVDPACFVAPSHSFDETTLFALKDETEIRVISDGFFLRPVQWKGFIWVPQQRWRGSRSSFGLWTICLHPNTMSESQFLNLESFLKQNIGAFANFDNEVKNAQPIRFLDKLVQQVFLLLLQLKRRFR